MTRTIYSRMLERLATAAGLTGAVISPGCKSHDDIDYGERTGIDAAEYPKEQDGCTIDLYCYDPWATCKPPDSVDARRDLGVEEFVCDDVAGPYAVEGQDPCCYTVGSRPADSGGMPGRPLLVAGRARLADLVERADWSA